MFFKSYLRGTIASKINVTPKGVYLPISKLHSILAVTNLLAHNNISQICYCGQISLQSTAVSCSFSNNLTLFGVTFILLVMVPGKNLPFNYSSPPYYFEPKKKCFLLKSEWKFPPKVVESCDGCAVTRRGTCESLNTRKYIGSFLMQSARVGTFRVPLWHSGKAPYLPVRMHPAKDFVCHKEQPKT